jgi:hypothetical protein
MWKLGGASEGEDTKNFVRRVFAALLVGQETTMVTGVFTAFFSGMNEL